MCDKYLRLLVSNTVTANESLFLYDNFIHFKLTKLSQPQKLMNVKKGQKRHFSQLNAPEVFLLYHYYTYLRSQLVRCHTLQ